VSDIGREPAASRGEPGPDPRLNDAGGDAPALPRVRGESFAAPAGTSSFSRRRNYLIQIDNEILWYSRRATLLTQEFRVFKSITLLAAASVPILAAFGVGRGFLALAGGVAVLSEGLQQILRAQEQALLSMTTADALAAELRSFLVGAPPYDRGSSDFPTFAARIEETRGRAGRARLVTVKTTEPGATQTTTS
jgi:hypothetical protein